MTTEMGESHADPFFWCSNAIMVQKETSQKPPSEPAAALSSTYEDLLLSPLSHCILPISFSLALFKIQHKALVLFLFFLYYHTGLYLQGCYGIIYFPILEGVQR